MTDKYIQTNNVFKHKEKIPAKIFPNSDKASIYVAHQIADAIREKTNKGQKFVLGLATGSTPINVYKELINLCKIKQLSFENVVTFNLDEYYPIGKEHQQSYNRFMKEKLLKHIDVAEENTNIPDGTIDKSDIEKFCQDYEDKIIQNGGIDLQILGIGRDGHIGFNEPGSARNCVTRLIHLDKVTRTDAASDFYGLENVPKSAITMGVDTVMNAKKIIIMAWSEKKAPIVATCIEGEMSSEHPATYLQEHKNIEFILDKPAASCLTRYVAPWTVQGHNTDPNMKYDDELVKKAVIWLSKKVNKPILRLIDVDFEDNGLLELVMQRGGCRKTTQQVFKALQKAITLEPATEMISQTQQMGSPMKKTKDQKKILIFSPHPADDVISMGGTMAKLAAQGHDLYVAYQCSGNIAVFDYDAYRYADFLNEFCKVLCKDNKQTQELFEKVKLSIENKSLEDRDIEESLNIKKIIRRCEGKQAAELLGVPSKNIYHLDLPFYETGSVDKRPTSEDDLNIVKNLIQKINPDQIYAGGDLTAPTGTNKICLQILMKVLDQFKAENNKLKDTEVFLYRGVWQEWAIENVSMAVPMLPQEMFIKREAIFKHQSQKDKAMFPGSDKREFWVRAKERNLKSAEQYANLGFSAFEGIELFVSLDWLRKNTDNI